MIDYRIAGFVEVLEDDAITPMSMARAFHAGIAKSRLQSIRRCGHLPPIEKPDEFVAAVTAFLRTADPSSMDDASGSPMP